MMMAVDHGNRRLWWRRGGGLRQRGRTDEHGGYSQGGGQLGATPTTKQHKPTVEGHIAHAGHFRSAEL
jgi:hypothetical protein